MSIFSSCFKTTPRILIFAGLIVGFTECRAAAQQVALSVGSGTGAPGASVSLNIALTTSGGSRPTVVKWTMTYSAAVVASANVVAGTNATAAGKSVQCSSQSGSISCVVYGMNNNVIADGNLATATLNIAPGAAAGSTTVGLSAVSSTNSSDVMIPGAGTGGTLTVSGSTPPTLSSLSCSPSSVTAPETSACSVALSAPALSGGLAVTLASNNTNVTLPASVIVPAAAVSKSFTATVAGVTANQSATLTATAAGVSKTFVLSIVAPGWNISGTITPTSLGAGATVTLTGAAGQSATADSSGNYTFTGLANGAYTVTPSKSGFTFTPANRAVTVNGANVTGVAFTATQNQTSAAPTIDTQVSKDQTTQSTRVTSPTLSTATTNELLLAFVASDDTSNPHITVSSVSGGGLTWVRVKATAVQRGTAEIWRALATQRLTNASVTATLSESKRSSLTVMSFKGVDISGTNGSGAIGATGTGNGSTGAPAASLVTTRANSLVVGVGNDPTRASSRTVGSGQTLVHQFLTSDGNTYWVQRQTNAISVSGTSVTINDSAPTGDAYNLSICEILAPATSGTMTMSLMETAAPSDSTSPVLAPARQSATTSRNGVDPQTDALTLINAASGQTGAACSPGGLASLSGTGLTTDSPQKSSAIPLPQQLAGLQVKVNGQPAPLLFASDSLVNFQCPLLEPGSPLEIAVVSDSGSAVTPLQSSMQTAAPGVFTIDGAEQGVIAIAKTGEIAAANTDGVPSRPASPGDLISIYASGLGEVAHAVPVGTPAPLDPTSPAKNRVSVVVGDTEIDPSFAGLAAGTVGLFQVSAQLPESIPAGTALLYLRVTLPDGTVVESNRVSLPIAAASPQLN